MGVRESVMGCLARTKYFAKAHSPEICLALGTVQVVGAIITACKGTLKFQSVLEEHNRNMDTLKRIRERIESGEATEEEKAIDLKKIKISAHTELFKGFVKCYWKTMVLAAGAFGTVAYGFKILKGRILEISSVAATAITQKRDLEKKIEEQYGGDALNALKGAGEDDAVMESHIDKDTGETVVTGVKYPKLQEMFGTWFDESNVNFERRRKAFYDISNHDYTPNMNFLRGIENQLTCRLKHNKVVYINEVLLALGFGNDALFEEGWTWGWKYYRNDQEKIAHGATNTISFGLDRPINKQFMQGKTDRAYLIFNFDPEPVVYSAGYRKAVAA